MTLRLYNTMTRSKEPFAPLDPNNVRMYVCGPTVYDYAHIGNARPAIVFDVLFRLLRHIYGPDHVTYVRNITDIDDKINARALELRGDRNVDVLEVVRELTERTYGVYQEDVEALGCLTPTFMPRATEHVPQMIEMIRVLIDAGLAYEADGHVLFEVAKKADYGKLSRRPLDEMIVGARVDVAPYKKNAMDFVLWKPSDANTPGWDSPWGRGRPGWHLECSSMIEATMGETIDIHGGGIDLVFPHHENEIAQSEGAHHNHPLAKVWMHNGFLNVEGEKMSKSLGNFVTIHELLDSYPGGALRLAMLQTHYRQPISWSISKVEEAWAELNAWASAIYSSEAGARMNLRFAEGRAPQAHPSLVEALSDDLNTSEGITALRDLYKKRDDAQAYSDLIESAEFLGLIHPKTVGAYGRIISGSNIGPERMLKLHSLAKTLRVAIINKDTATQVRIEKEVAEHGIGVDISYDGYLSFGLLNQSSPFEGGAIQGLIEARLAARKARNFKEADRIRDELLAQGIQLKDNPDGTTSWDVKR